MIAPIVSMALTSPTARRAAMSVGAHYLAGRRPQDVVALLLAMQHFAPFFGRLEDAVPPSNRVFDEPGILTPETPFIGGEPAPPIDLPRARRRRRRRNLEPIGPRSPGWRSPEERKVLRVRRGMEIVKAIAKPGPLKAINPVLAEKVAAALSPRARARRRARRMVTPASEPLTAPLPTPVVETPPAPAVEPTPAPAVPVPAPVPTPAPGLAYPAPMPFAPMPGFAPWGASPYAGPPLPGYANIPMGGPTPPPDALQAMFRWANAGQSSMRSTRFQKAYEAWARGEGIPLPHQGWGGPRVHATGVNQMGSPYGFPGYEGAGFDPYAGGMQSPMPFGAPGMDPYALGGGVPSAPFIGSFPSFPTSGYGEVPYIEEPYSEYGEELIEPQIAARARPQIIVLGGRGGGGLGTVATALQLTRGLIGSEAWPLAEEFEEINELAGPEVAMSTVAASDPALAEVVDTLEEIGATEEMPSLGPWEYTDQVYDCGLCDFAHRGFQGRLPSGRFYSSALVQGSLSRDLGDGVHGEVKLGTLPFPIRISAHHTAARGAIALAHELAHVANLLYKMGLPHDKVHELGAFFATEGLPMMKAYENFLAQKGGQPPYSQS